MIGENMEKYGSQPSHKFTYITKELNHPPSVLRQISVSIEPCLSKQYSNEKVFKEYTQIYQEDLKNYDHQLTNQKSVNYKSKETKQHNRKITWCNPAFSKNVSTKVGNKFLKLINTHFPRHHKHYKLFNKNNVKVIYSFRPNIKNMINTHNKKIINPPKDSISRTYNCIKKTQCPPNEKCII